MTFRFSLLIPTSPDFLSGFIIRKLKQNDGLIFSWLLNYLSLQKQTN